MIIGGAAPWDGPSQEKRATASPTGRQIHGQNVSPYISTVGRAHGTRRLKIYFWVCGVPAQMADFGARRRWLLQCFGKAASGPAKGIREILNSFLSDHTTLHLLIPGLAEDFGLPARLDRDNILPPRRIPNKLDIEVY